MADGTLRVRDLLEQAILEGDLKPGERLRAEALAQRFGTSARRSARRCCNSRRRGWSRSSPTAARSSRTFDRDDLLDLYEVRALLEPQAAALAARTHQRTRTIDRLEELCDADDLIVANEAFHRIILEAAGSPRLTVAMRAASGIPRAFRSVFWHDERQREESLMCHRRLVAAFSTRDAPLAEAVMRMHILGAIAFLEETWPSR